jgi:hypothetical protein
MLFLFFHALGLCCLAVALLSGRAAGADVPALPSKPVVRMVSPGSYEVGKVRLDQKSMSISFAGTLNMKRGLLEYLVVHSKGSVHESLLVTEVEATDIHVAILLLGAKGDYWRYVNCYVDGPNGRTLYSVGEPEDGTVE